MSARREKSAQPRSSTSTAKSGQRDLLSREEEYKRLNAELERKTANLVKEAEQVINQRDSTLFSSSTKKPGVGASLLGNISTDDFLDDWDNDVDDDVGVSSKVTSSKPPRAIPSKAASASVRRPPKSVSSSVNRGRSAMVSTSITDNNILTEVNDLHSAVSELESRLSAEGNTEIPDDILPSAAQEMGSEAQIRFLKAKARVMHEEMEKYANELALEKEESTKLTSRIKELEDERNKLSRANANQQTQLDKSKKAADDARNKSEFLETQISSMKKELEELRRSQKQQHATQSAADVRLNRALEEAEKYKLQISQMKEKSRSTSETDKQRIDRLMAENKKLEKQKGELMAGFKKQLKLIDILKRQKMHIEAAKMLSFAEEDFVKALEWGS